MDLNYKLWIFGNNKAGQLGIENKENNDDCIKTPSINMFFKNDIIKEIECGNYHSMAIKNNNICYLFGINIYYF